jgi:hypothetical protein
VRCRGAAVITVFTILGVLMAGCGSTRDDEKGRVTDRMEELWRSAGVDPEAASLLGYDFTHRPGAAGCRGVPDEKDHWFANRTAVLRGGVITQKELLRRVSDALEQKGYRIWVYRSTGSESRTLKARSAEDRTFVELFVDADGHTTLDLTRTPCAGVMVRDPGPPYVLESSS